MKVKVLGIQFVDYVSRKTGNPVKGVTLHSCYPDGQVKGEAVDSIFVSDNLGLDFLYQILPGDEVDIEYNNRGYVAGAALSPGNQSPGALWAAMSARPSRPDPVLGIVYPYADGAL